MGKYSSNTLAELQALLAKLNKSGIFPFGHTSHMSDNYSIEISAIQRALKGRPAALPILRSIIEEAERLTETTLKKIPKRPVRDLSITDLYDQSFLPSRYSELAAEIANVKPATVRNFIRNQREGRTGYATSDPIKEALYQISEMNEEWELKCRAEKVLEKFILNIKREG